jgi:hypothetical protein
LMRQNGPRRPSAAPRVPAVPTDVEMVDASDKIAPDATVVGKDETSESTSNAPTGPRASLSAVEGDADKSANGSSVSTPDPRALRLKLEESKRSRYVLWAQEMSALMLL